jgi:hypothetical protein
MPSGHSAVRLQLFALAYNLANFLRTLALPDAVAQWSLTSLREKLIKIGARGGAPRPLRDVPARRCKGLTRPDAAGSGGELCTEAP